MKFLKNRRANHYTFFFWISFSIVLFLNLLVWLYLNQVEKEFHQELRQRMLDINQVFSRLITEVAELNDDLEISRILPEDHNSIQYLYYRQLIAEIRRNSKLQTIQLISPLGEILVSAPEKLSETGRSSFVRSEDFENALKGKIQVSKIFSYSGEKFISGFAPIRNVEGFISAVLVTEAKADFFAVLGNLKNRLLLFSLINMGIIITIAFFLFTMIRRSIRYQAEIKNKEHLVELGTMAATVAHEIRNPLGIIDATNDLIRKKYAKEKDEVFDYIPQEVKRLNVLIGDFLKFAREPQLNISVFSEKEMLRILRMSLSESNWQRCKISVHNDLPMIYTDINLVEQCLLNVLQNAIQASDEDQKIQITFSGRKKALQVMIRDFGKGISEKQLASVFKPFFSTKEKGTGLGLAITRRLTEHLGGTIHIESQVDGGTTVTLIFPDLQKSSS